MKLNLQTFSDGEPTEAPVTEDTSAEAQFEELIKGKYSDAFRSRVQGIIDKRFSKMKAMEKSLEAFAPLKQQLEARFPQINGDDTAALVAAFLGESTPSDTAEPKKSLPEGFMHSAEALLKIKAAESVRDALLLEGAELRRLYPSFDLKRELTSSPEMCRLITAGVPLRRAYEAVNMERITDEAVRTAVIRAKLETAESIRRSTRVQENSLSDRAASKKHTDVNNLTEAEIRKIIADVGNGARVTF